MRFLQKIKSSYQVLAEGLPESALKWLKAFTEAEVGERVWGNSDVANLPPEVEQDFVPYRLEKPTKLYRGLSWHDFVDYKQDMEAWHGEPPKLIVGKKFPGSLLGVSSWTTDRSVAKGFSEHYNMGIVVEALIHPEQSLVDMNRLPADVCKLFENECKEKEVITVPDDIYGTIVDVYDGHDYLLKEYKKISAAPTHSGNVYLIHFETKLHHAAHYIGWAKYVKKRFEHHKKGSGARLLAVLNEKGIGYDIVKVWRNKDRTFERQLKNQKNSWRYCPTCLHAKKVQIDAETERDVLEYFLDEDPDLRALIKELALDA